MISNHKPDKPKLKLLVSCKWSWKAETNYGSTWHVTYNKSSTKVPRFLREEGDVEPNYYSFESSFLWRAGWQKFMLARYLVAARWCHWVRVSDLIPHLGLSMFRHIFLLFFFDKCTFFPTHYHLTFFFISKYWNSVLSTAIPLACNILCRTLV